MKSVIFLLIVLLIFPMVQATPLILVDTLQPQPLKPGGDLTLGVTVTNQDNTQTRDISFKLDSGSFYLKGTNGNLDKITLCSKCSQRAVYYFTINPGKISGTYPIQLIASDGISEKREQVDVLVRGLPNLVFTVESSDLNNLEPNKEFDANLKIKNIGSGIAKEIKTEAGSKDFVIMGSSVRVIEDLKPSEERAISLKMLPSADIKPSSYLIPIIITYQDEQGNSLNSTDSIGVKVINRGQLSIKTIKTASNSGKPSILTGDSFTTVIRLENSGKGDADSIKAEVVCPFAGSMKTSFIGQLKKDEDAPAVFDFSSKSPGNFECALSVLYSDDTGNHTLNEKFEISVLAPDEKGFIIFGIVVAAMLLIFRKKIRKRIYPE